MCRSCCVQRSFRMRAQTHNPTMSAFASEGERRLKRLHFVTPPCFHTKTVWPITGERNVHGRTAGQSSWACSGKYGLVRPRWFMTMGAIRCDGSGLKSDCGLGHGAANQSLLGLYGHLVSSPKRRLSPRRLRSFFTSETPTSSTLNTSV